MRFPIQAPRTEDKQERYIFDAGIVANFNDIYSSFVRVSEYGAKGDGTTDDSSAITNAIAGAASGDTILFDQGTYLISGTSGLSITTAVNFEFRNGSKLLFDDDSTEYVTFTSVTGVYVRGLVIDSGTPTVRSNNPALLFSGCSETFVDGYRVISCAGAGYLVSGGSDHHIQNSHVKGSLADGYHWTGAVERFTAANCTAYDTGDDSFAVVGYLSDGARVSNGNLTGLVSVDSAASGFKISGGENVVADVTVNNATVHGIVVCEDSAYSTYSTRFCDVRAVINTVGNTGVIVTEDASDLSIHALVYNATDRGWNVGGSGKTVERILVSGQASISGSIGFQGTYVDDLTVGPFISYLNTSHGFAFGNITNLTTGTLHAYNNNTGADVSSDNVFMDTVINAVIGGVLAIDDRATKLVHRGLHVVNSDYVTFGPIQVRGSTDTTWPIYIDPSDCTEIRYSNETGFIITFGPADATPSVAGCTLFKTSNGVPTTITTFDGGYIGQKITVIIGDPNTTIDFTGTNLKGNGGVDWSPGTGDYMECLYDGTDWLCSAVEI